MADTERNIKLDVRAYPIAEPKGSVVAFASVTIDDMFAVTNMRVINSDKGLFVAMPQVKDSKGEYRDICFPVTADLRKLLNDAILGAYALEKQAPAKEKESTVDKLRDGKREAREKPAPAKAASKSKAEPEL
jgi:stage V sporulation protein G